jgi:hypothetical protein
MVAVLNATHVGLRGNKGMTVATVKAVDDAFPARLAISNS